MLTKSACLIFFTAALATVSPAFAQETPGSTVTTAQKKESGYSYPSGFVGLGGAMAPKYDGSSRYKASPFVIGNIEWEGMDLQFRSTNARLDILDSTTFQFGPVVALRSGRDGGDGDGRVARLHGIDDAVEIGGFVGYRFGGDERGQGEIALNLTALHDVSDTHDGFRATAQISYAALRGESFSVDVDASTTYGDKDYTRTYFGVTPAEAGTSGLAAYQPGGGLQDVSVGITIGYRLSDRWGLIGRIGGSYYVGDVKDSPIIDEGSAFQGIVAFGPTFRF